MKCLIDGDVLVYELGFASETAWKYTHFPNFDKVDNPLTPEETQWLVDNPPSFDYVEALLLGRIEHIEETCKADEPSLLFFTGKTNFRTGIAKRKQYKDRAENKPFHYYNIKAFLKGNYEYQQTEGLEADDLMAIFQTASARDKSTIICTRDKDLRQVAGWHFGWELGKSPQFGPYYVEGYGSIAYDDDKKVIKGVGNKFFLSQCLTGDTVDTVPGLPKCGSKGAFQILGDTKTYKEGLQAVLEAYRAKYGENAEKELLEQGQLLWMTRNLNDDGSPVTWRM